jgi:hypothetical protein
MGYLLISVGRASSVPQGLNATNDERAQEPAHEPNALFLTKSCAYSRAGCLYSLSYLSANTSYISQCVGTRSDERRVSEKGGL